MDVTRGPGPPAGPERCPASGERSARRTERRSAGLDSPCLIKTQVQSAGASPALARDAVIAPLERIGTPVILMTHSQGGGIGFEVTEALGTQILGG
ncbi:MAG: hypothetical protein ABJA98_17770 [Acidobacteriota bacterium]